ncbi:restriction endonuclease subunit S [Avibacterium paragallinarum]|uniref:restriction endonuclease subunit S n=1 Tax=Avibacterium paragallinarum TaxID=728 RepID=UPI00021ACCE8|nr:restriction endonuclease subunit S [Avibacterium paragallinarum]QIR12771.1 restriction endonuclease subunit S [Avibacterium paragallinarum]QJE10726.1 restriction endonuclease subunit S [Avibacterium paragallinarum]QJE12919.1 restriction endonuclease subunit S [Avibacterium paragallinarum]QJE15122.1 restriction endonuclease subunit S [Avibacterium paragallinarum]QJE19516.1 restriction endonuclease subunit S [Avibacterium paragallinarum]
MYRKIEDISKNFDKFRKPLSSRERSKIQGEYPYYGAAKIIDYVDGFTHTGLSLLIAEDGSVETEEGFPVLQLANGKYWVNNHTHVLKGENDYETKYLYYALKQVKISPFITGAVQKKISQKALNSIEVRFLENASDRKKVVDTLDAFDQKITLNTQTNQTLEQIAQAIFKHWFIDFAPVHAKANALASGASPEQAELATMACLSGKTLAEITALQHTTPEAYHQLQQTAQAFPSEFVESEMGLVPKGWGYKFLNEVCKIAYGKNLPTKQLLDQGYPVFGGNGIIGYFDRYLYEQPQTLISCRGAASGKIMYSAPKSFITNNSLIIESNELLDYFYIYEYLKNKDITPYISGSAQPQITISSIEKIKILLPQEFILERYSSLVSNLYNKIYLNNKNNELLAKTRDQLLPKLLNGEVEL